jgi:hypothetical protein
MKTKIFKIWLICLFSSLLLWDCSSNPVGRMDEEQVISENNKKPVMNYHKNDDKILTNYYEYYNSGCLIKCWDYEDLNPLWTDWAAWEFIETDTWGGKNYKCQVLGDQCVEYSWRAVYCGIINPQNIPTPGYTNNVAYIQTLMSQAGYTFVGNLSQWSYEEIYVQPHYQFPAGTSQINIDFINLVDYQ